MAYESERDGAAATMRQINQTWLDGRVESLAAIVHPDIVMVFPGFAGRQQGREEFLAAFRDFTANATVHEFHEHDLQADVAEETAVVTFRYEMVYERSGKRNRSTGRDLWIFQKQGSKWIAVWRTMFDMVENAA